MKIQSIHLQNFKRFTDLQIQNIPPTAKLVVLLGPNGCGKSSLFDALHYKSYEYKQMGHHQEPDYYFKMFTLANQVVPLNIEFHDTSQTDLRKAIYVRTAYRNDPVMDIGAIQTMQSVLQEIRFGKMIENDAAAGTNFQRLASNALERAFKTEDRAKTLGDFQDETLGEIQRAMKRLFPDLVLNSLGNPLSDRTFTFDKGTSKKFPYKNLSGGEKSAFDLLLDIFVKKVEYDDTVFCIDEPEAHMNPRLQGKLLEELFRLIDDNSQLWIATHAIGMMRQALQLHKQYGEKVVFLDFSNRDFDNLEVMEPTNPNRRFWEQTHEVVLDDLAALVEPDQIVICEGRQGDQGFDAECYTQIFSEEFPNTKFVSAGGKRDLQNYISVVEAVTIGVKVFGLRDFDRNTSPQDVARLEKEGVKVLRRGKIENYLLVDDVLRALCQDKGLEPHQEKVAELIRLRDNAGDIKGAPNQIRNKLDKWGVHGVGETYHGFLRDTLALLIKPGMPIYDELKEIIFGSDAADT
ncbi:MAG: AAA family ATPase [Candidatus Poribacteria bacterium]|nr:AAA family ATPase [Candidatus Poribacteria bacterium]